MDKIKEEKLYSAKVGTVKVEGKTYKELTYNYLNELVNQNKNLQALDRLKAYIEYFVDKFDYDYDAYEKKTKGKYTETIELNEQELSTLFTENTGVCQQYAQALTLISVIDKELTEQNIHVFYASGEISKAGEEMGHAINLVSINGKLNVVDISSMIHVKEGKYKGHIWDFALVSLDDYFKNIYQEGIEFVQIDKENKELYIVGCKRYNDFDKDYLALNLDTNTLKESEEIRNQVCFKIPIKPIEKDLEI